VRCLVFGEVSEVYLAGGQHLEHVRVGGLLDGCLGVGQLGFEPNLLFGEVLPGDR
jgi:hypothetical protein